MKSAALIAAVLIVAGAGYYAYSRSQNDTGESDNSADLTDWVNQAAEAGQSVFDGVDDMTAQNNIAAFLRALRLGEGTSDDLGYLRLCGGGNASTYDDHPANLGWRGLPLSTAQCAGAGLGPGCVSTAAVAYQFTKPTWNRLAEKLGLSDFSPSSQDQAAIELISEKGALEDVKAGRVSDAVAKVRKVWASLPGADYAGQGMVTLAAFTNQYQGNGGLLA